MLAALGAPGAMATTCRDRVEGGGHVAYYPEAALHGWVFSVYADRGGGALQVW